MDAPVRPVRRIHGWQDQRGSARREWRARLLSFARDGLCRSVRRKALLRCAGGREGRLYPRRCEMSRYGATILDADGLTLSADERAFFRDANPFGFILFARNIEEP